MKKRVFSTIALLCSGLLSYGQFNNPVEPENVFPTGLPFRFYETVHTSSMGTTFYNYSDLLHVYSWSGEGTTSQAGFAWRWTDNTGATLYDQGSYTMNGLMDVDVAVTTGMGSWPATIIAAYYSTGVTLPQGHYYTVFEYAPGGGLSYVNTYPLSSATTYGRISIDISGVYEFNIVWQDGNVLRMGQGQVGGGGALYNGPFNVPGTTGCKMPDVACITGIVGGGTTQVARIVYLNPSGQFVVRYWNINDPSLTFYTEDVSPAPAYYTTYSGLSSTSSRLNLACGPTSNPWAWDNYAYVYENANNIKCRVHQSGSPATTVDLCNGSLFSPAIPTSSMYPTVTYEPGGNALYCGWWCKQNGKYIAAKLNSNGTAASAGYLVVSNGPKDYGVMSFAKNWYFNWYTPMLFCVYPQATPPLPGSTQSDMVTKAKPWSTGLFKQAPSGIAAGNVLSKHLIAGPNPFTDRLTISVQNGNAADAYEVVLSDVQGRVVQRVSGTVSTVNEALAAQNSLFPAGTYLLRISGKNLNETVKIVKQ